MSGRYQQRRVGHLSSGWNISHRHNEDSQCGHSKGLFHCVGQWRQCTSGRYGRYTQQEIHCCRRSKSLRWLSADGKEKPGYENGKIFTIEDILTKEIIPLTEATADSIGDDRINVTAHALTKDYLTIEYQYLGSMNENKNTC